MKNLPTPHGAINKEVILSSIKDNIRITSKGHFQDTRHIAIDYSSIKGPQFEAGDVVMI